jgi:hypothetical protein
MKSTSFRDKQCGLACYGTAYGNLADFVIWSRENDVSIEDLREGEGET